MSSDRIVVDIMSRYFVQRPPGPLRNVRGFRCSDPLDRAGDFSFTVPSNAPWFETSTISLRNNLARIYIDGTAYFTGIIEQTRRTVGQDGTVLLEISGRHLLAELAEVSVGFLEVTNGASGGTNLGPSTVLTAANAKLAASWALGTTNSENNIVGYTVTGNDVYAKFAGETALQALVKITERTNNHFVADETGRQIFWFRNTWQNSGIRAIQGDRDDPVGFESNDEACLIQSFNEITDGLEVVTRIYPYGGGQGETRLTIEPSTITPSGMAINRSANYIEYNPNSYPLKERHVEFKDITPISNTDTDIITAANQLVRAAAQYLRERSLAPKSYRMRVTALPLLKVRPGLTIRVEYEDDTYSIDDSFYVTEVRTALGDDGALVHDLTISNATARPMTEDEYTANMLAQGQVFMSHQQMGPNVTTISYREALDDDHDAEMRFWLGDEIAQIQQVLLRYRVDPLRSTVKSTGGTSTSTGPSSITTTASGGGATPTSGTGNHIHPINIPAGSIVANVGLDSNNNVVNNGSVVGSLVSLTESGGHTHSVTIPAHTHNMAHTHDVTASITTSYGVHEESSGNTYAVGDLAVDINGVTLSSSNREDLGGGWYAFDLTDEVKNSSTFRPYQEANTVTVSQAPNASKSAQITAQIQVRAIIQSVAYT